MFAVFEVAYSSLLSDRRTKQRLYAGAGIPVYVIVNLQDDLIEVLSEPSTEEARYCFESSLRRSEQVTISLENFVELTFSVDDLI